MEKRIRCWHFLQDNAKEEIARVSGRNESLLEKIAEMENARKPKITKACDY